MSLTDYNIKEFLELGATLTIEQGSRTNHVLKDFVEIAKKKNVKLTIKMSSFRCSFY